MSISLGDRVKPSEIAIEAGMNPDIRGHIVDILPDSSIDGGPLIEVLWPNTRVRHRPEMVDLIPKSLFE